MTQIGSVTIKRADVVAPLCQRFITEQGKVVFAQFTASVLIRDAGGQISHVKYNRLSGHSAKPGDEMIL